MELEQLLTPDELTVYNSLTSSEGKRLFNQYIIKNSFASLIHVLGYRDWGAFHRKEIDGMAKQKVLQDSPSRRLWLWARGHFKTSLIIEAHTVYLIINNPDIRILIVSNTLDISRKILNNIKSHFTKNEQFRYIFSEFCPTPSRDGKIEFGTVDEFRIPNRIKALKEPTVMCAGIGTNLTGLHFDYMKIDDLVTRDSVSNETQIELSKDYYASLRQLFDNPTIPREDISGTIYHFNDLHKKLTEHPEFEKSFIKAASDMSFENITFPERFTKEGLEGILNDPSVGPYVFSSQYMLNPINPADVKFDEAWLKYYNATPEGLAEYVCVDPASTQKKKSDYTVFEHWGIDEKGNHYLLNGVRDKLTVYQRIDTLFALVNKAKNLKHVKYEVLGGRHGDLEMIRQRMREKGKYFSLYETKSMTASKIDRIEQRLVGAFHAGIIFLPQKLFFRSLYDGKVYDFVQEYKLEFLQFPFCEHDDCLDCHSQMFEKSLQKGKGEKIVTEVEDEWEWWHKQAMKLHKPERKRFIFGQKNVRFEIPAKQSYR